MYVCLRACLVLACAQQQQRCKRSVLQILKHLSVRVNTHNLPPALPTCSTKNIFDIDGGSAMMMDDPEIPLLHNLHKLLCLL